MHANYLIYIQNNCEDILNDLYLKMRQNLNNHKFGLKKILFYLYEKKNWLIYKKENYSSIKLLVKQSFKIWTKQ